MEESFDNMIDSSIQAQKVIRATNEAANDPGPIGRMNGKAPGGQELMGVPRITMPPAVPPPMTGSSGTANRSIGSFLGPSGSFLGPSGPEFLPSTQLEGGFKANGDPLLLDGVQSEQGYIERRRSGVEEPSSFESDGSEDYKFIPEDVDARTMNEACRIYGYDKV
jgi:hypothetical protein